LNCFRGQAFVAFPPFQPNFSSDPNLQKAPSGFAARPFAHHQSEKKAAEIISGEREKKKKKKKKGIHGFGHGGEETERPVWASFC
jgi:hypothetical protein